MRTQARLIVQSLRVADAVVVATVLAFVWNNPKAGITTLNLVLLLLSVPLFQSLFRFFGVYDSHRLRGVGEVVGRVFSAQVIGSLVLAIFALYLGSYAGLQCVWRFFLVCTGTLIVQRWTIYSTLHILRRRGLDARNVCVLTTWEKAERMAKEFAAHPDWGLRISCVGIGSASQREFYAFSSRTPLGNSLEEVLKTQVVDEVIIAVRREEVPQESLTLDFCEQYGLIGRILLDTSTGEGDKSRVEDFFGELTLTVGGVHRSEFAVAVKRALDLTLSALLILLLSPVLLIIALLIRMTSHGPALFRQTRVGLNGRKFTIYKFRTMLDGAETLLRSTERGVARGPVFKDPQDYRVTDIGRVLRRSSLDELPQLFNIIKGDMSLVGPRPLPVSQAVKISGPYRRRFCVLPGLTCIWQVSGRSDVAYETWMKYDLQYIDKWSLWLDTKLLLLTLPAVVSGKGAY